MANRAMGAFSKIRGTEPNRLGRTSLTSSSTAGMLLANAAE